MLLYWMGINLDIEERKQAEFYLAEGQRLAHTGSWMFNAAGFEYWSPELFAIHGLDPGRKAPTVAEYIALVHPDDREFVAKEIQKMLTDRLGFDFTKRIVHPDGSIRYVRCVGMAATSGGIFQGFVGTGIDVTEHEELTKALRKVCRDLEERDKKIRRLVDANIVGIFICTRSIVDSHGGRLWASANTGPGATFLFTLLSEEGDTLASQRP
jgi:PAS domain S-box-containing protein